MSLFEIVNKMTEQEFRDLVTHCEGVVSRIVLAIGCRGQDSRIRRLIIEKMQLYNIARGTGCKNPRRWTNEQLMEVIPKHNTWSGVAVELGLSTHGTNLICIRRVAKQLNLDITHITSTKGGPTVKYTLKDQNDVLCINNLPRSTVKNYVLRNKLIEYKCSNCAIGNVWNGKELVLQLDHINGTSNDHRLSNLRFLCPNCHSQTDTFAARNKM